MVARAALVAILSSDAELTSLGLTADDFYGPNSADSPNLERPFFVIRLDDATKAFVGHGAYVITLWAHTSRARGNDMSTIDSMLSRARELLQAAEHVAGADGWTLTSASWQGDSADFVDDGFNTNTRFSRWRIACRAVVSP
jgi:hypothetical protein